MRFEQSPRVGRRSLRARGTSFVGRISGKVIVNGEAGEEVDSSVLSERRIRVDEEGSRTPEPESTKERPNERTVLPGSVRYGGGAAGETATQIRRIYLVERKYVP